MPKITFSATGRGSFEMTIFYGPTRQHKTYEAAEASVRETVRDMKQKGLTVGEILHYATDDKKEVPTKLIL